MNQWPGLDFVGELAGSAGAAVAGPFAVRTRPFASLDVEDWIGWWELGAAAGDDNLFAAPWFTAASLASFDGGGAADLVIVHGAGGRWIGMMVVAADDRLGRVPLRHWHNWSHSNQFLGTPLVRVGAEEDFWRALLSHFDGEGGAKAALRLTELPEEDRVTRALFAVTAEQARPWSRLRSYDRAIFRGGQDHVVSWGRVCSKRRSRLRSLRRRLAADHGDVTVRHFGDDDDVGEWVDRFLAIESSGWKGSAGSALAADPATARFFRDVVEGADAAGRCAMAALEAGGQTIAMSVHLIEHSHGFGFKKCYDEAFAAYAPGLLLLEDVTRDLAGHDGLLFDSCSAPDQASVNGLWPDRRTVVDLCVSLGGGGQRLRFRAAMAARTAWHWIKQQKA